jgi:hypothetical protein
MTASLFVPLCIRYKYMQINHVEEIENEIIRFSLPTQPMPRILFVSGFHPSTRARDLAFEFERYVLARLGKYPTNRSFSPVLAP